MATALRDGLSFRDARLRRDPERFWSRRVGGVRVSIGVTLSGRTNDPYLGLHAK